MRRIGRLLFVAVLSLALSLPAFSAQTPLETQMAKTATYLQQTVPKPSLGTVGGEWTIWALVFPRGAGLNGHWQRPHQRGWF